MEIPGSLYDVVFFLIVFILIIALLVAIAELKRSLDKKKFQEIEIRRKQVLQEKMKALRKKQEELDRKRAEEEKARMKMIEKEQIIAEKESERGAEEQKRLNVYADILSKMYSVLMPVLQKNHLYSVTKKYVERQKVPVTLSENGITLGGYVDEKTVQAFIVGLIDEYDDALGWPVGNICRAEIEKYLKGKGFDSLLENLKMHPPKGISYLVEEEEPRKSYNLFGKYISLADCLCITRGDPEKIRKMYGENFSIIWLTNVKGKDTMDPTDLERLMQSIERFLGEGKVLIIDGIEYLIVQNNYKTILKFIQSLNSMIVLKKSMLIVPVNPSALDTKELALLEREMNVLK
ncbi:MAG: DUF835 domain-containing protein [Thermoplasmatales archaeon]|nr:DUF835 domain-containing protein [Thermoplasmatales archaeon]